jgi:hypothetical protein
LQISSHNLLNSLLLEVPFHGKNSVLSPQNGNFQ